MTGVQTCALPILAGLFEVGWAVGLKYSEGFTRLQPSLLTAGSMIVSLGLLGVALRQLPLGTAYAVWTGVGTVGTALLGMLLFREPATAGRLVCIGRQRGGKSELDVIAVFRKRLTITGSTLRPRPVAEKGALAREVRQHVWPLLASGAVKVLVHATFPLAHAAEAHRMMEASEHIGKIILLVQSPL